MDDAIARRIEQLRSWDELNQFMQNATDKNNLTTEIKTALDRRGVELGRAVVAEKTDLDLTNLSPAEEKIVQAVSMYVSIKAAQGSHASRTFSQLRNRGLIGAAENAVCRRQPSLGFQTLADVNQSGISYEKIVIDHPNEFSARAIWHSRQTLGLPNQSSKSPADGATKVPIRSNALILWLKDVAKKNGGTIPLFTNEEALEATGFVGMSSEGRVHGNVQTRIDFSCYMAGFPPLGLAADAPFEQAWSKQNRNWSFPIASMQKASRLKKWTDADFDKILNEIALLPGDGHAVWKEALTVEEASIREWAFSFGNEAADEESAVEKEFKRNAKWSRDELILALELYIKHRSFPLAKDAIEVIELSRLLNQLGRVLGQRNTETYRNENGVYMKLMNFRRFDPNYTFGGKTGLTRGSSDEALVWEKFAHDQALLLQVANFIRNGLVDDANNTGISDNDEPGIEEAEEGKVATRVHRYRERDRRLVNEAKVQAIKKYGRLFCAACNFDFSNRYGEIGNGIIDVHHTKPVHTMLPGEKTKVSDLVLLCSNCHRIVHSKRQWLSVEEVRASIQDVEIE